MRFLFSAFFIASLIGCGGNCASIMIDPAAAEVAKVDPAATEVARLSRTSPTFDVSFASGVSNLSQDLTINGTTVAAELWCQGEDATVSAWTCDTGGTLPIEANTGPTPVPDSSAPFSDGTDSVLFAGIGGNNAAEGYVSSSGSVGAISTEDSVFEVIAEIDTTSYDTCVSHYVGDVGWYIAAGGGETAGKLRLGLDDGDSSQVLSGEISIFNGLWAHIIVFADRSGSGQMYINGVASGSAADITASSGTLTDASSSLRIGNLHLGKYGWSERVAHVAMWKSAAWLDTHLQADVAAARFAQLTGTYPSLYAGTATPTFTRAGVATLSMYDAATSATTLHNVGSGWPRVDCWADTSGDRVCGYLSEAESMNSTPYSENVPGWSAYNTVTSTDTTLAPDGSVSADTVTDNAAVALHVNYLNVSLTDGDKIVFSSYLSKSSTASDSVLYSDIRGTTNRARFNVSDCSAAQFAGSDLAMGCEDLGDYWRIWISGETNTTAAEQSGFGVCEGASTCSYGNGGSAKNVIVWGHQYEINPPTYPRPGSYIATAASAVTRPADVLTPNYDNAPASGTVEIKLLCRNYDLAAAKTLLSLDDGSADNLIELGLAASGDVATLTVTAATVAQAAVVGTTDVVDGTTYLIRGQFVTNNATLLIDGSSEGTPDTSVTIPTVTAFSVGADDAGISQPACLIQRLSLWDTATEEAAP